MNDNNDNNPDNHSETRYEAPWKMLVVFALLLIGIIAYGFVN